MIEATIHPLNEGYYTIGFDKVFYPFDIDNDILEERSRGSLLVEIQPFIIKTADRNILIDTGLGFKNPVTGNLKILDNLSKHDLTASDITDVVLSHLHKDHAGGLISLVNGNDELVFNQATFHINKKEFEFALEPANNLSYDTVALESFNELAQIEWLENGRLLNFIEYYQDGGHCPYHCSLLIYTTQGPYFFGGDVAPQLKQLKFRYIAKYDYDGKKSLELRTEYAKRGREDGWTFLFYHDVKLPMSKL